MHEIQLTQDKVALIDDDDLDLVDGYKWHAHCNQSGHWYAKTRSGTLSMHRQIMNPSEGFEVDHINGDGLDNRRENLRIVTSTQNKGNMKKQEGRSSEYKGVTWDKSRNKWIVHIHKQDKQVYLGRYFDEEIAAKVYDDAAREYFGEHANTNF